MRPLGRIDRRTHSTSFLFSVQPFAACKSALVCSKLLECLLRAAADRPRYGGISGLACTVPLASSRSAQPTRTTFKNRNTVQNGHACSRWVEQSAVRILHVFFSRCSHFPAFATDKSVQVPPCSLPSGRWRWRCGARRRVPDRLQG